MLYITCGFKSEKNEYVTWYTHETLLFRGNNV